MLDTVSPQRYRERVRSSNTPMSTWLFVQSTPPDRRITHMYDCSDALRLVSGRGGGGHFRHMKGSAVQGDVIVAPTLQPCLLIGSKTVALTVQPVSPPLEMR